MQDPPTVITTNPLTGEKTGMGALRVANVFTSYYLLTDAANGRKGSADSYAIIFLFTTFAALYQFRTSNAWRVGDIMVAMPAMGVDGRLEVGLAHSDVLALEFKERRLIVKPILSGIRIEPLDL